MTKLASDGLIEAIEYSGETSMTKKQAGKIKPPKDDVEYNKAKTSYVMAHFGDRVRKCRDCGWPCMDGYCCNVCGSANP